jgi:hypothetical protein
MTPRHTPRRAAKLSESGEGKRGTSSGKKRAAKLGSITWRRSAGTHGAVMSAIQTRRKAPGADRKGRTDRAFEKSRTADEVSSSEAPKELWAKLGDAGVRKAAYRGG